MSSPRNLAAVDQLLEGMWECICEDDIDGVNALADGTAQEPTDNRAIDAPPIAAALPDVLAERDDAGKLDTAPPSTHTDPRPRVAQLTRRTFQPPAVRLTRLRHDRGRARVLAAHGVTPRGPTTAGPTE